MQSDAIADWQAILGPAHVLIDEEQRHRAGTATFASPHGDRPVVLQPGSTEEVMACMHVARRCGIALYPVSRGRNWGYGSAVPFRAGCVILSLARLQRISAFHETLGHVTVEPGVTFGQLNDFLRAQGSALFLNCPGSGAGASVLGLHLEKGLIPGPDADRWEQMCSLDVILPGGERIQTGLASITGARAAACARAGIGPVTEGLFLQS